MKELQFPKTRLAYDEATLPDNIRIINGRPYIWQPAQQPLSPKHKKRLAKQLRKAQKERDESLKQVLNNG